MDKKRIWELGRDNAETYREKKKLPVVLVVDNVRSLNNIGRTGGALWHIVDSAVA